jgi:hypothetical protein
MVKDILIWDPAVNPELMIADRRQRPECYETYWLDETRQVAVIRPKGKTQQFLYVSAHMARSLPEPI